MVVSAGDQIQELRKIRATSTPHPLVFHAICFSFHILVCEASPPSLPTHPYLTAASVGRRKSVALVSSVLLETSSVLCTLYRDPEGLSEADPTIWGSLLCTGAGHGISETCLESHGTTKYVWTAPDFTSRGANCKYFLDTAAHFINNSGRDLIL